MAPGQTDRPRRVRCRIRFGKRGVLRYTSHLDLARIWERLLRRVNAPLVYSQGFNPRPQMQLAAALPLGFESVTELIDVWLEGDVPSPADLLRQLTPAAPEGLNVVAIWSVDPAGPALQTLTRRATYRVVLGDSFSSAKLQAQTVSLLARTSIPHTRRKKEFDLRPLIEHIDVLPGDPPALSMTLSLSQEHGTGRPDDVLDALGFDPLAARITRTHIDFGESVGQPMIAPQD
jgi:radical SAM-linked protein